MFTGLVEAIGKVLSLSQGHGGSRLTLDATALAGQSCVGDSVAIDGACLTVEQASGPRLAFDLSPETLSRTTLGGLAPGAWVNLERALKLSDRLGGHFVAGHVDGVGRIKAIQPSGEQWTFWFSVPHDLIALMFPKGSIAVDGISLTIVDLTADSFSVAVVPHTFESTTLGRKGAGDAVNIETDMLAKMVFRAIGRLPEGGISEEFLREHGFR